MTIRSQMGLLCWV